MLYDLIVILIIVGILLFIVSFIILILALLPPDLPKRQESLSTILPRVKTGDLLLVSYRNVSGYVVKIFTQSIWTHVGLVYREGRDIYVLECGYYHPGLKDIIKNPILQWLQLSESSPMVWIPLEGGEVSNQDLNQQLEKIGHGIFPKHLYKWLPAVIRVPYRPKTDRVFFCSELIAYLFQELGIMKKEYRPSSYSPKDFMSRKITLEKPYFLGEPVGFTYS